MRTSSKRRRRVHDASGYSGGAPPDRRQRTGRAGLHRVRRAVRRLQATRAHPARRPGHRYRVRAQGRRAHLRRRGRRQRVPVGAYEPPTRIVFSWDIGPTWQIETNLALTSEVEIRFVAETPSRTRVELEHRNIDRHGPGWESIRDGVDTDTGWPLYLSRYESFFGADS
ncbi:SRPBCC domain-containing protein [Micromonospora sp. NPDC005553]|uniref:SRPBCC domain-containing protein n=1 Tax=Micromonospora sp. NPDC005553 TaxID=3364232 RepID=UPI00369582DE